MKKCTKAIIPVAGYGTRRLPITKTIEKCMLPLLNRPIVDYVVEDCIRAGLTDIYFVVSPESTQLRAYYRRNEELEAYLTKTGKQRLIPEITPPQGVRFYFIEQDQSRYGTTVPVWLCRDVVGDDEQVVVIMGDQCLYRDDQGSETADLLRLTGEAGYSCGMVTVPVPLEEVSQYGVVELNDKAEYVRIVEKPTPEAAPSRLNNASFYIFDKPFFHYVEQDMARPHDGEYMLTDVINDYVQNGGRLKVVESTATYLDCGTTEGWVSANTYLWSVTQK